MEAKMENKYIRGQPVDVSVNNLSLYFLCEIQSLKDRKLKSTLKKENRMFKNAAKKADQAEVLLTENKGYIISLYTSK